MLTAFIVCLAIAWAYVSARWIMFAEKPSGLPFKIFSVVVIVLGVGTSAYLAGL